MPDVWVFGYGSLMWRPGFAFEEQLRARIDGFHRALCVYSWVHRGTRDRPGLVLGLDQGGSCEGLAFRVAASDAEKTIAYLRGREQVTGVYLERQRSVDLHDGRRVEALTYVVDRTHAQYAGVLTVDEQLRIVARAHGQSGANPDYILNTADHLRGLDIRDQVLEQLAQALRGSG